MGVAMNRSPLPHEERALVRACGEGDRQAQTALFRAYVQRVHGLIHRVVGPATATEDLVQEAFIRIFRSIARFRGEAQLATWIGRIALRVAYEHLRASRAATRLESVPEGSDFYPGADEQVAAREGLRRLYRILDRLDPKYRIAFTLHVIEGLAQEEVAALMSASTMATKTRIWRARREVDRRAREDAVLGTFLVAAPGESS
jgi:RNA polymerase sigma-70 factor, ECF subfamily